MMMDGGGMVEIRLTASQGILEGLLETEELETTGATVSKTCISLEGLKRPRQANARSGYPTIKDKIGVDILSTPIIELTVNDRAADLADLVSHLAEEALVETIKDVHGQVDRRVESKTALVGAEGRVVLDTVSTVDLKAALVVAPGDTELDDTLGDGGDGEGSAELGALSEELAVLEGAGEL
jgi:hypothetical protein